METWETQQVKHLEGPEKQKVLKDMGMEIRPVFI